MASILVLTGLLGVGVAAMGCGPAQPKCLTGQALCSGVCIGVQEDSQNCGACGNVCEPGQACQAGACVDSCSGNTCTDPINGGAYCSDPQIDNLNCGACGNLCDLVDPTSTIYGSRIDCFQGRCEQDCTVVLGKPSATRCADGYCLDLNTSDSDCGVCGNACSVGTNCLEGSCTADCAPGKTRCTIPGFSICIDIQNDPNHCGGCFNPCDFPQTCQNGTCVVPK